MRDGIAHQHPVERRREFRGEIAHLVGVREDHIPSAGGLRSTAERGRVTIGRVLPQQFVIDRMDLREPDSPRASAQRVPRRCRALPRTRADPVPRRSAAPPPALPARSCAALPSRCSRTARIPLTIPVASNRSFSTSFAAASFGGPSKICERLVFSGRVDPVERDGRCAGPGQFGRGNAFDFFVFGFLDAHQRGVAQFRRAGLDGRAAPAAASRHAGTSRLPVRA